MTTPTATPMAEPLFSVPQPRVTTTTRQAGGTLPILYTGGHSNYTQPQFVRMIRNWLEYAWLSGVEYDSALIVDVRTYPRSRHNPQYNGELMERWIPESTRGRVQYMHEPRLGGRRCKRGVYPLPHSHNRGFTSDSFVAVADHAETDPSWMAAIDEVLEMARTRLVMVMCSEAAPYWNVKDGDSFHCHRTIIADGVMLLRHVPVLHVTRSGKTSLHKVTRFAEVSADGEHVIYPARAGSAA